MTNYLDEEAGRREHLFLYHWYCLAQSGSVHQEDIELLTKHQAADF